VSLKPAIRMDREEVIHHPTALTAMPEAGIRRLPGRGEATTRPRSPGTRYPTDMSLHPPALRRGDALALP